MFVRGVKSAAHLILHLTYPKQILGRTVVSGPQLGDARLPPSTAAFSRETPMAEILHKV